MQGPEALPRLGIEVAPFTFREGDVLGVHCLIAGTGYTGERGCELGCAPDDAVRLWDAILDAGIVPCGLGARDTLRLEVCYPLHGNDISPERTPIEAGLGWACALDKEFTGVEVLRRQKEEGTPEKLVAFVMDDKGIPRQGMAIEEGGTVTSGSLSPMLDQGIGLAYVDAALAAARDGGDRRPPRRPARCSYREEADLQTGGVNWLPTSRIRKTSGTTASTTGRASTATRHVVGITWYAQDALGELVHFEPPEEGASVAADESYGEVESVKAVSDLISPLSGEVIEVNQMVRGGAGEDERRPVRRRLADQDPAQRSGRGRRPPRRGGVQGTSRRAVAMRYLSLTDSDQEAMLAAIGVSSIDELFQGHPRASPPRPAARPRAGAVGARARRPSRGACREGTSIRGKELSFLGAGIYDHYVPAIVDAILARGEFLTAYTPYQPEMSQGVLQAIFEYQTVICELTGMDVSNASGYDGTTVAADACYVAKHATGRTKVVLAEALNPQVRQVVKTYAPGFGLEVVEVPHTTGSPTRTSSASAAEDAACVIFQQPNFFGCLEAAPELAAAANEAEALAVAHVDPVSLGVLEAPGRYGCDDCDRRRAGRRQLPVIRRAALRVHRHALGLHPAHARPHRRRDDRHRG